MSNLLLSKIGHVISEFPLAFKQTKEVKLFMTLLVKNEEGMLEENLQFHKAMGVDGFIITDNNSTDSTPDIIRKYKQKGWIFLISDRLFTPVQTGADQWKITCHTRVQKGKTAAQLTKATFTCGTWAVNTATATVKPLNKKARLINSAR